jgi:methyl-coenzyme M reductase subunit C
MPRPEKIGTKGMIVDIVTGVIRGVTCPQTKLDEIVSKVKHNLAISDEQLSSRVTMSAEAFIQTS